MRRTTRRNLYMFVDRLMLIQRMRIVHPAAAGSMLGVVLTARARR